jgi:hypothetical protein
LPTRAAAVIRPARDILVVDMSRARATRILSCEVFCPRLFLVQLASCVRRKRQARSFDVTRVEEIIVGLESKNNYCIFTTPLHHATVVAPYKVLLHINKLCRILEEKH